MAPSAISPGGLALTSSEADTFETPRALSIDEIPGIVEDFRQDAIAFGRLLIANPDLPRRLEIGSSLNRYDHSTFYGGAEHGYTDYPFLETEVRTP